MKCCVGEYSVGGRPAGYKNAQVVKVFKEQYFLIDSCDSEELARIFKDLGDSGLQDRHQKGSVGLCVEQGVAQFYVALQDCEWLDGVMPVVGNVLLQASDGYRILEFLGNCLTLPGGKPKFEIKVVQCGQF